MLKVTLGEKYTRHPKSALHDKRLSGKAVLVLAAISECVDNTTNSGNVSIKTVCELARSSKDTVYKCLEVLEDLGYLTRESRTDRVTKATLSNRYTVHYDVEIPVDCIIDRYTYNTVLDIAHNLNVSEDDNETIDFSGSKSEAFIDDYDRYSTKVEEKPKRLPRVSEVMRNIHTKP